MSDKYKPGHTHNGTFFVERPNSRRRVSAVRELNRLHKQVKRLAALPEKWRANAMGWGVESYDECADELEAALKEADDE